MNINFFLVLAIVPSAMMSTSSVCRPQVTRQVCPICAKFIQIRSSLRAQNDAIRIKAACLTLVRAKCCSGIRMTADKPKKPMQSRDQYASLPFALI